MSVNTKHFRSFHRIGREASLSMDAVADRLFAGSIVEALELCESAPESDRDELRRAVISWDGCAENEKHARKDLRGSAWINAILNADYLLNKSGQLYRTVESPVITDESINYPLPVSDPNNNSENKPLEIMCEVTFPAHAPTAAATSSLLAAK